MCCCVPGGGLPTARDFPHHIRRCSGPSAAGGKGKQLDGELDDGVDSPVPHHLRAAYAHPHPTVLWQDILLRYWKHWRHKDFGISASRERYFWSLFMHVCICVSVCVSVPAGSPSLDWDVTLYVLDVDQPSMSVCVFVALSTVFHFYEFSPQLFTFSLCSSGLVSALLALLNYVCLYESLPQPWYNPLWLTGLKAPTN